MAFNKTSIILAIIAIQPQIHRIISTMKITIESTQAQTFIPVCIRELIETQ